MIFDAGANLVVGSMGWVDKSALWIFNLVNREERAIAIEGAKYLSVRAGSGSLFRIIHHGGANQAVSIRSVALPDVELTRVEIGPGTSHFSGDLALWRHVEGAAIIASEVGQRLVLIDAVKKKVIDLDLSWYSNENYDLGYQGLTDCMTVARNRVFVSVQRSSKLVVIDLDRNARVGTVPLAGRDGNPALTMLSPHDFIATDYDSLCRVDVETLKVLKCVRLQDSGAGTRQFIGDCSVGWNACAVARPFSSDVLRLEQETFQITARVPVSGQPLAACLISENRVVTRDWKTGRVAVSEFPPSERPQ